MKAFKLSATFYIVFTLVALPLAVWLAQILQGVIDQSQELGFLKSLSEFHVLEAPTAIAIIGLLLWAFDSFLWRVWPFPLLLGLPDVAGRYVGEVESSFDNKTYPITMEIRQTLTTVAVNLYTERSSSFSVIANVGENHSGNKILAYVYKNTPRTVSTDLDMRTHDGFACLEFFAGEEKLVGHYYNDPRERATHGKLSCRRVGHRLLGHA